MNTSTPIFHFYRFSRHKTGGQKFFFGVRTGSQAQRLLWKDRLASHRQCLSIPVKVPAHETRKTSQCS